MLPFGTVAEVRKHHPLLHGTDKTACTTTSSTTRTIFRKRVRLPSPKTMNHDAERTTTVDDTEYLNFHDVRFEPIRSDMHASKAYR